MNSQNLFAILLEANKSNSPYKNEVTLKNKLNCSPISPITYLIMCNWKIITKGKVSQRKLTCFS
jgi:hypothetical protein